MPTKQQWEEQLRRLGRENPNDVENLRSQIRFPTAAEGGQPPGLQTEINAVMFGSEWCLITMGGEPFTEYELWIDAVAPFDHTMVFGFTNDIANPKEKHYTSYILTDRALALSIKHPDQAARACRDAHRLHSATTHENVCLPYAVGIEGVIKEAIESLWAQSGSL